ncbi:UDP-glucose/GDP-mannose dehydrogenase family protein [Candidatus Micrarchaeota archaeon]|nr:UDP-glucose/GDP-mannose dehydrogenase family protein [Candidatus Micrarchaeota archaeon]
MKIGIVGSGYVGLVTGCCLAELGHKISCMDVNKKTVEMINNGKPPIFENGLEQLLAKVLTDKRLKATDSNKEVVENSDIIFLCVGTPAREDGSTDLTYVKKAAEEVAHSLKGKNGYLLICIKSTVPVGTNDLVLKIIEDVSGKKAGKDFGIASTPEFLREGKAIEDFYNGDKIVIGFKNEKDKVLLEELFKDIKGKRVLTDPKTAELIKYANNSFLATKISFSNEIGNVCKKLGVDVYEVMDAIGTDKRIGREFLNAGAGFGGSCFPKDVKSLVASAKKAGYKPKLLENVIVLNESQPFKMIELLKNHLPKLSGKRIGVLGLAFKPDTDDIREAPSLKVVKMLIEEGATVEVYDPKAMNRFQEHYSQIKYCKNAKEVLEADAVLILTEWEEFKHLNYKNKTVIDGRNIKKAREAKIYEGICW